jgi:hypothetical protein
MKEIILLIGIGILSFGLSAQSCEPDTTYPDSVAGVFPAPITADNPDGGIDAPACPGNYYEYTLTVIIPDSATINVAGFPIDVELVSAQIATEDAINGLPPGIDYLCMPNNCVFEAEKTGCLLLFGTVDEGTPPGKYSLSIDLQITVNGIGTIDVDFPGPQFPGEYFLEVVSVDSSICLTSTKEDFIKGDAFYPNPVQQDRRLYIKDDHGIQWLEIMDTAGHLIHRIDARGYNSLSLENYASGLYYLRYKDYKGVKYQKVALQ